ncbi:MAG: hypothetical protein H7A36_07940 [Chlamydiales bacterium]|nr:hypothetical protein [Chlamydiales bacterium]
MNTRNKHDELQVLVMAINWNIHRVEQELAQNPADKASLEDKLKALLAEKSLAVEAGKGEVDAALTFAQAGKFLLRNYEKEIYALRQKLETTPGNADLSQHLQRLTADQKELKEDLEVLES